MTTAPNCIDCGEKPATNGQRCQDCAPIAEKLARSFTIQHATVQRDGYEVPLIGVPPSAVLETCDCCHEEVGLSQAVITGKQTLCQKCASLKLKLPTTAEILKGWDVLPRGDR